MNGFLGIEFKSYMYFEGTMFENKITSLFFLSIAYQHHFKSEKLLMLKFRIDWCITRTRKYNIHYLLVQSKLQIFRGYETQVDTVMEYLPTNITARFIRLRPTHWYLYICTKLEIYGCEGRMYFRQIFLRDT